MKICDKCESRKDVEAVVVDAIRLENRLRALKWEADLCGVCRQQAKTAIDGVMPGKPVGPTSHHGV